MGIVAREFDCEELHPIDIVETLAERGELENTYIVFTSDNGYHLGQHRFFDGKFEVYEEDIRVPLIIRGPGVSEGVTVEQMAVNIDLAPTMARWGRATPDRIMDGQSLTPLLGPDGAAQNWRQDFLVELYRHLPPAQNGDVIKAVRTEHEVYVEYRSGPRRTSSWISVSIPCSESSSWQRSRLGTAGACRSRSPAPRSWYAISPTP